MRIIYILLLLSFSCSDCSDLDDDTPNFKPATFEIIEAGVGVESVEPLWHLNAGSYIEGYYSVLSKHDDQYRVIFSGGVGPLGKYYSHRWKKSEHGLVLLVGNANSNTYATEPVVVVPTKVRSGMRWKTSGYQASAIVLATIETVSFGSRRMWTIKLEKEGAAVLNLTFMEGIGPVSVDVKVQGVIVLEDDLEKDDTFVSHSVKPTLFDKNTTSSERGLKELDAVDVTGADYLFMFRAINRPIGAQAFERFLLDYCLAVGEPFSLDDKVNLIDTGKPEVDICPVRYFGGKGESRLIVPAAMAVPEADGVIRHFLTKFDPDGDKRIDIAFYLPHFYKGEIRVFSESLLISSQTKVANWEREVVGFNDSSGFVTETSRAKGVGGEEAGKETIGLDFDSSDPKKPLRYFTTGAGWVTVRHLVGSQPLLSGESWYLPAYRSTRTHDEGREVFLTYPDGVVMRIDIEDSALKTRVVAQAKYGERGAYVGAVRYKDHIALATEAHEILVDIPFVKVPAIDAEISLPTSFALRVQIGGVALNVCYPKRFSSLKNLDIRVNGKPALRIYESELADGCGVLVFEDELLPTDVVEATLPKIGKVRAATGAIFNISVGGNISAIPLRSGKFMRSNALGDENGLITGLPELPYLAVGDGRYFERDPDGYGLWVDMTTPEAYFLGVRLSHDTGVTWPTLPFKEKTFRTTITSYFRDGTNVVCGKVPNETIECFSVSRLGEMKRVTDPYIMTLKNGEKCYYEEQNRRLWCGPREQPLPVQTTEFFIPKYLRFASGSGIIFVEPDGRQEASFFDPVLNTVEKIGVVEDAYVVGDDGILLGIDDHKIYRLEGRERFLVFDQTLLPGIGALIPMVPGSKNVLVGDAPHPYDPAK